MRIIDLAVAGKRERHLVHLAHLPRTTPHASLAEALDDPAYIVEMLHLGGRPGGFIGFRPTIRAFASSVRAGSIDFSVDTLWDVRAAVANAPRRYRGALRADDAGLQVLPDLILYGQTQGLIPQGKWSIADLEKADAFRRQLISEGLHENDATRDFRLINHFIIWARLHCIDNDRLDDGALENFAAHDCCCGLGMHRTTEIKVVTRRRALRRWRRFCQGDKLLTENGTVRRENRKTRPPFPPSVTAFETYLLDHLGFTPPTIKTYVNDLAGWQAKLGENAGIYDAERIRAVCQEEFDRRTPGAQTRFLSVLRNYIGFRAMRRECDPQLLKAIISRPTYTQGTVPKTMPFATLRGFIDACDVTKPVGLRARAVMTLLLETGIRASEVGSILIDEIDWERAEFLINAKGRQREAIPLPDNAGNAILDWIENGRPETKDPHLFIRLRRPFQAVHLNSGISTVVQAELRKQGVSRAGAAHIFRHSFAREHLHRGMTLPQIGRLLRHQILDTTQIYAKVDDKMLAATAQDWPGEAA